MRVWDVAPGYLSRQRLLGEHREIHGLYVVLSEGREGYSRHPETLRWKGFLGAVQVRHALLVAEMEMRGYTHRSPMPMTGLNVDWPTTFIDLPEKQFQILSEKYGPEESGRIVLPRNSQQLWAQHKYSVMARSPEQYKALGRTVARLGKGPPTSGLCAQLIDELRAPAPWPRTRNALAHMWGYVSRYVDGGQTQEVEEDLTTRPKRALQTIRTLAQQYEVTYLLQSTALSELEVYLPN